MLNFAQFVQQAMPEVERIATEMAEHYGKLKHPHDEYYRCELVSYYANGRIYEMSNHTTWAGDMQDIIMDSEKFKWSIDFNPETKVFRFEKHFSNGMYRIATYTPYNKDALDITVHQ